MYPPPGPLLQLVDELIEADPLLFGRLVQTAREEGRSAATFDFNISEVEVDFVGGTAVISDVLDAATEAGECALEELLQLFQFADQLSPALTAMLKREFGESWRSTVAWLFALPERAERFLVAAVVACDGSFAALPGVIELGRTDWRDLLVSGRLGGDDWQTKIDRLLSEPAGANTSSPASSLRGESSEPTYVDEFDVDRHKWGGSTRPCDFSLALGDGVFADFDVDADRRPVLLRISFDGYGCCTPEEGNVSPMNAADASTLLRNIESGDPLDTEVIRSILRRYFETHRNVVWEDALVEWGLVQQLS